MCRDPAPDYLPLAPDDSITERLPRARTVILSGEMVGRVIPHVSELEG